jgi:3-oxoacyl-[acyl-carrier-protein] synthase II
MNNVVVTGIGLVTPLGLGRDNSWNRLLLGQSAVQRDEQFKNMLSARVHGIDVPQEARTLSLAFLAAAEAVADSGLEGLFTDFSRFGCTVSSSKPNILNSKGKISFSELFLQSTVGRQVARILKLGGPVINVSAACATGAISMITAARWIESGICDMVVAGAVECPFHPLYVAGFERMGVLAKNTARPFDAEREGFAMGEGAGVILLENKGHAMLRGAKIYGEISGWGLSNDTCDEVSYDSSGKSVALAVEKALEMSGLRKVDYIHAHGTGTRLNDPMETKAYKNVFGRSAKKISISSTKAATGHMLGASGAVGTAFALLSMRDNAVPPTLNLLNPDPECELDYTPNKTVDKDIHSGMSVSFGFGGQTAAVCVTKI